MESKLFKTMIPYKGTKLKAYQSSYIYNDLKQVLEKNDFSIDKLTFKDKLGKFIEVELIDVVIEEEKEKIIVSLLVIPQYDVRLNAHYELNLDLLDNIYMEEK